MTTPRIDLSSDALAAAILQARADHAPLPRAAVETLVRRAHAERAAVMAAMLARLPALLAPIFRRRRSRPAPMPLAGAKC